jgi:ubiquinone/menaquinone biosynthesis C-methylase UbiE
MTSSRPRRIEKAVTLLRPGIPGPGGVWADIGCGDGIFTAALYGLIQTGGEIYAVDRSGQALKALTRNLNESFPNALIYPVQADFTRSLALPPLDGLVMANSLHFVRKKTPVLARLVDLLEPGGRLIIVEYNTTRGNYAVPHPLDEAGFLALAHKVGLHKARVMAKIPSTFLREMYAGIAFKSRLDPASATYRFTNALASR